MTVAFTICSNNYISQAKALADSIYKWNPEIVFYIGLADRLAEIPETFRSTFETYNILEVSAIEIPNFQWMHEHYDIIELNTATKPFYFNYLFKKHPEANKFIFFDPDIFVYQPLTDLENSLDTHNIIFTPHLSTPITDSRNGFFIHEHDILNHGIFNLGFVAMNASETSRKFVNWWADRLATQCKHDLCHGLFVDQLWCNLAPCYFDDVLIDKDPGKNVAYWNLQERYISIQENQYWVNEKALLTFFHFSTFNPTIPHNIATKQNRFTLLNRPDLRDIYASYEIKVAKNHFYQLKDLKCVYGKPLAIYQPPSKLAEWLCFPFKVMVRLIEKYL